MIAMLVGIDVVVHEAAELFLQRLHLVGILEIHGPTLPFFTIIVLSLSRRPLLTKSGPRAPHHCENEDDNGIRPVI